MEDERSYRRKKGAEFMAAVDIIMKKRFLSMADVAHESGVSYYTFLRLHNMPVEFIPATATLRKLYNFVEKYKDALNEH